MPVYDRACDLCAWSTDFAWEPVADPQPPCPECGATTHRFMAGHGPMVIPDTFSTPVVDDVMRVKRQIHYSRSERKARMKHSRLQEYIRWSPGNESDKSCLCGRWDTMSRHQLDTWREYFLKRHPLTDDEKARLVLTDRADDHAIPRDPQSPIILPEPDKAST